MFHPFFLIGKSYNNFPSPTIPNMEKSIKHTSHLLNGRICFQKRVSCLLCCFSKSIAFGCIYLLRFRGDKLNGFGWVSLDRGAVGVNVVGS